MGFHKLSVPCKSLSSTMVDVFLMTCANLRFQKLAELLEFNCDPVIKANEVTKALNSFAVKLHLVTSSLVLERGSMEYNVISILRLKRTNP